jgi:hypothetical protein
MRILQISITTYSSKKYARASREWRNAAATGAFCRCSAVRHDAIDGGYRFIAYDVISHCAQQEASWRTNSVWNDWRLRGALGSPIQLIAFVCLFVFACAFIRPQVSQIRMKYLLKVRFNYKQRW